MELILIAAAVVVLGVAAYFFVARKQLPHTPKEILEQPSPEPKKEAEPEAADSEPAAIATEPVPEAPLPEEPAIAVVEETPEESAAEVSLESALEKTRTSFWGRIRGLFGGEKLSDDLLEEIEEVLYTSDLGPATVQRLLEALETSGAADSKDSDGARAALKSEMSAIFESVGTHSSTVPLEAMAFAEEGPTVWMIVGVNGAGKTTTIGKIASQLRDRGKSVMIVAGDTFRAAAVEQLEVWSQRSGAQFFSNPDVTDPSAIAFQGCEKALAQKVDVILIDTAGRLHTQSNLMEELKKMKRVIEKKVPDSPHETLIVLDSNSGQNALIQAKEFNGALDLTGVVLTKLDGTAKGGVAVGVACELSLPVKLIGVGEKVQDLRGFSSAEFVDSIL